MHLGHFGMDMFCKSLNAIYDLCLSGSYQSLLPSKYARHCSSDSHNKNELKYPLYFWQKAFIFLHFQKKEQLWKYLCFTHIWKDTVDPSDVQLNCSSFLYTFLLAVKSFKPQSEISWPWNLVQKHDGEDTSTLNVKTIWTQVLSSVMSSLFGIEHGRLIVFSLWFISETVWGLVLLQAR